MTLSPSPFGQMVLNTPFCGPIAHRFAWRPSLRDVAWCLLFEQWHLRGIKEQDLSALLLYRFDASGTPRVDELADVLIECFCENTPLALDVDSDYLSFFKGAETPFRSKVDVVAVQALINESAPYLLSTYQQALYEYWEVARYGEGNPLHWLATYLHQQCTAVIDQQFRDGSLDSLEAATARVIASFPKAQDRALLNNLVEVKLSLLGQATCADQGLDPELASAIFIEREVPQLQRNMALLFTLSGALQRFDSRQALSAALVSRCKAQGDGLLLREYPAPGPVFLAQALLLREQQQELIGALAQLPALPGMSAMHSLLQRLDEASSLLGVCQASQREMRERFRLQLPSWLGQAGEAQRRDYAGRLLRLASLQQDGNGTSFLDGVPDAFEFAREKLLDALRKEHPQGPLPDLDDLQLVNRQVTAVAGGNGGDVVAEGEVQVVRMSPMQFALANLAVLRAGSVSLYSLAGAALPDWLTVEYLKDLVTRLDVGGQYPPLLQRLLLDERSERDVRQRRFSQQLCEQVPLLALETRLRDPAALSAESLRRLDELFLPINRTPRDAVIRPLSFIARSGASPDVAQNAWLIEAPEVGKGPCLLYRPLHRQALREFASREAFFQALCKTGELQDDILQRLPEARQPIYAHGGFAEPHVVRFFPGDEFSLFSVPALAKLGEAVLQGNLAEQLYQSCARELIERARRETLSSSASRWLGYEELGWLMFNTVLPFFNGTLVKAAWMLPLFTSLRQLLAAPDGAGQASDLRQLLLNLALLLLPEPVSTLERESAPLPTPGAPDTIRIEPMLLASPQPSKWPTFGWGSAVLSAAQRDALAGFRREIAPGQLGEAQDAGDYQGLYRHQQSWWAALDGAVYQLAIDADGPRLVDLDGNLGPWVRDTGGGRWQLDFGLRLRGGMPVNRRIAQLRESNRQRVLQLEEKHTALLSRRLESSVRVQDDLEEAARQAQPSIAHLEKYAEDLREQDRLLLEFDDNLRELQQLKAQPEFKRMHARNLYDRAGTHAQLAYVLHSWFSERHAIMRDLRPAASPEEEQAPEQVDKMRRMMDACRQARRDVDELLACHAVIADMRRQLRDILPGGPALADKAAELLNNEPSLRSWVSVDLSLRSALILDVERSGDYGVLYSALLAARTALSMRDSLDLKDAFSESEQLEILDSVVSRLDFALESTRLYRALPRKAENAPALDDFNGILERLQREAQDELARRLQMVPEHSDTPAAAAPERRKQVLIRTRNRGVVVGSRRKPEGDRPETVVVVDPIDNSELARYEESAEPGVWQPVGEVRGEPATPTPAALATLVRRSTPLLNNAERRIAKVRSQAKSATVGADIEDILVQQARPLDALAQQIQEALTRENATDDSAAGIDAARQCVLLNTKATQMREEGRRLRVEILKRQAPTVGQIAWLRSQDEVVIAREGERVALAKRKGFAQDYLQEFVIRDKDGSPLWYAHFHYASADAQVGDFSAAHLKTREQRYDRGPQAMATQSNQAIIEVYRSRIDKSSAQQLFLSV